MSVATRTAAGLIVAMAAAAGGSCATPPPPLATPPNILFIFADDHAYQAIGAYGSQLIETPNIDRIAAEGMRFDRALVTNSICAPSRAVVLTGKYSHVNGVIDNVVDFDGSQPTLPKILGAAGYQTAAFGKWHLKSDPTGFDTWEVLPGQGNYYNPEFRTAAGEVGRTGYVTDLVTDSAIEWIGAGRDPERPFFMWLGHKAPHRNWSPGPDQLDAFAGVEFPEPPTLFDDYAGRASPAAQQEMEIGRHMTLLTDLKVAPPQADTPDWEVPYWQRLMARMTPEQAAGWDGAYAARNAAFWADPPSGDALVRWKYQEYLRDYLRTIAAVDDSVGRVLEALEASGIADNTVVVYSSDQGFYLGEHGWFDKRWIYEESLRTPLLVRWPDVVAAASTSAAIVSNVDYAQTFLEIAGVPDRGDMQGRSLVPLLRGESPADWRQSFYYRYYEADGPHAVAEHYGVVTDRYKLVRFPATDEWELLDRQVDPLELRSVHADPAYAATRADLEVELERLRERLGDQ